jgi:phosphopantothenoylcysteine decarboxylase/phosphopantothenate--cysteine ligase
MANQKIKKGGSEPCVKLIANPDILATLSQGARRPSLVVGFAAETENVIAHAQEKRARKGCDWIVANDVSPGTGIMGGEKNAVHLITANRTEDWPEMDKRDVGLRLAARIAETLRGKAA